MHSTIKIPLTVTKYWLYFLIFLVSFLILLPISFITYLNFYKILIPKSIISIPLTYEQLDYSKNGVSGDLTNAIDKLRVAGDAFYDDTIIYDVKLNTQYYCPSGNNEEFLVSYDVYNESDIITMESMSSGVFDIVCGFRFIHGEHNWLVPYNLKYWVPPILVNNKRHLNLNEIIFSLKASEIVETFRYSKNIKIKLDDEIVFKPGTIDLQFIVKWNGIRYYLFNYYYTCLIIGVGLFWFISCFVSFLTSIAIWSKFSNNVSTHDRKVKLS